MVHPHHDGSDLYVSNSAPKIGDEVTLKVRVPKGDKSERLWLRLFHDGEPRIFELRKGKSTTSETWWSVTVEILNLVTRYRFLLVDKHGYRWLNAEGVFGRDVVDREDFQIIAKIKNPDWIGNAVFYQIFPDRFATSGQERKLPEWVIPAQWNVLPTGRGAHTGVEFYGGDFKGVTEHLQHLEELGANAIYLTPFFPSRSNHRYDASSFDHVDPLLGGDEAFIKFSHAAQKRGFRIIGDLTTNHCGIGHEWIQTSLRNPDAKERAFFYWDKSIRHGYVGWLGVASLPKLNYQSDLLREKMYLGVDSIVKKWLKPPFKLNGWRIDVANMTGRYHDQDLNQEVARGVRNAIDEVDSDAWLVAENADHAPSDLDGFGWQGTMNYAGFTRPVWGWLNKSPKFSNDFFGLPTPIPTFTAEAMVEMMRSFSAGIPWRSFVASMLLLDSHDTARFKTVVGCDKARHIAGVTMLLTYPGVPSIFAGDEIGLEGEWGEDSRRTIDWEHPDKWDQDLLAEFRKLIAIRKNSDALSSGGLRWVDIKPNSVAYLRESERESVLVFIARSAGRYQMNLKPYGYTIKETLYGPVAKGTLITISTKGAISGIWRVK